MSAFVGWGKKLFSFIFQRLKHFIHKLLTPTYIQTVLKPVCVSRWPKSSFGFREKPERTLWPTQCLLSFFFFYTLLEKLKYIRKLTLFSAQF